MNWLSANSFFLIILLLCVGIHLFHGHGDHGNHGADEERREPHDHHNHH